jgi:hypothetical protein
VCLIYVIYASLATRAFREHEIPATQRLIQSKRESFSARTISLIRLRALRGWIQGRAKTLLAALAKRRWQLKRNGIYRALGRTARCAGKARTDRSRASTPDRRQQCAGGCQLVCPS